MVLQVNLIDLIQKEGIELRKGGKAYTSRCPFHDDHNPSLSVYPDSNRFICFGCGEKGDAIDFIKKLKGFSFKYALAYLGVDKSGKTSWANANEANKRKLVAAFRGWERDYYDELTTDYRAINSISSKLKTLDEMEEIAPLYHRLPILEYHMDILLYGNDDDKFALFKEVAF
jgi:DNA primase